LDYTDTTPLNFHQNRFFFDFSDFLTLKHQKGWWVGFGLRAKPRGATKAGQESWRGTRKRAGCLYSSCPRVAANCCIQRILAAWEKTFESKHRTWLSRYAPKRLNGVAPEIFNNKTSYKTRGLM